MHCDTSTRPIFDLTKHKQPLALYHEVFRFVRGIRGHRSKPVTRKQIAKWLYRTPATAVDEVIDQLVTEGKIVRHEGRTTKYSFRATISPLDSKHGI